MAFPLFSSLFFSNRSVHLQSLIYIAQNNKKEAFDIYKKDCDNLAYVNLVLIKPVK